MLFHSSLRRELSRSFGATLIVLVTVVMTMILIRTLGQASRGSFNPSDVTLVMGYTVLAYLPTLLTMSLFIAIIASLSRMYRDSEMVIWLCSGKGLASLLRPLWERPCVAKGAQSAPGNPTVVQSCNNYLGFNPLKMKKITLNQ